MSRTKTKKEVQKQLDSYFRGNIEIRTPEPEFRGTSTSDTELQCLACGYTWNSATRTLIDRANKALRESREPGNGCPKCNKSRVSKKRRLTVEKVKETINKYTNKVEVIGELDYSGKFPKVELRCKECGHEWSPNIATYLYYLKKAHWRDCPNCNIKQKHKNLEYDLGIVKDIIKRDGIVSVKINGYNQKTRYMDIECIHCGNTFSRKYVSGRKQRLASLRCPNCNRKESSGEYSTRKFLDYNHIRYEQEYRINNPLTHTQQRMDFYLFDYNIALEIMGEQHYIKSNGFNTDRLALLDYCKYAWAKRNGVVIQYLYYDNSILRQLADIFKDTSIPPQRYYNYDNTYMEAIDYIKEGNNFNETMKHLGIGKKALLRFIKMAGYKDYHDLADQVLQERNGFNYDDLINWLRHHHGSTLKEKFGVTMRYVQRHIFEKDDYPYSSLTDIKNETIKSSELPEYRKTHNRRETERYFLTDYTTINRLLGTKEW